MSYKILNDIKAALEEASKHPGFYNVTYHKPIVSDLELKIRKEVMDAVDDLRKVTFRDDLEAVSLISTIQDRLNLLWSER